MLLGRQYYLRYIHFLQRLKLLRVNLLHFFLFLIQVSFHLHFLHLLEGAVLQFTLQKVPDEGLDCSVNSAVGKLGGNSDTDRQ